MFSKKEAQLLTSQFWTAFGKSFPRKWILYDTKIKDFSFKFSADSKSVQVSLDLEMKNEVMRSVYLYKMKSLENFLKENIGDYFINENLQLENGKMISRIWVEKSEVSIYNKNTWPQIFEFFVEKMNGFENVFLEFEDYIKDV